MFDKLGIKSSTSVVRFEFELHWLFTAVNGCKTLIKHY